MCDKNCMTCQFSKPMGYRQIFCEKKNEWQVEVYVCERWEEKKK